MQASRCHARQGECPERGNSGRSRPPPLTSAVRRRRTFPLPPRVTVVRGGVSYYRRASLSSCRRNSDEDRGARRERPSVGATAESIVALGTRAEALGFDSLWVSDQLVIPSELQSSFSYGATGQYDIGANQNFFEALTVLTYLAGRTNRVHLGTSVLVLPYRQPLVVAKQWATLDALSGGRTVLGVGAGFMREQFEVLGMDIFDRRGAATDEAIRLFRTGWAAGAEVSFTGEVFRFQPVRFLPKPARREGHRSGSAATDGVRSDGPPNWGMAGTPFGSA